MSDPSPRTGRRAVIVIIVAVGVFVLLGFAALVIDIGAMFQVRSQLQVVTEAGALAGASHLDGTDEGLDRAREAALALAIMNPVRTEFPTADELVIELGAWNPATNELDPSTDPEAIDAIRLTSAPRSVPTPFAGAAWRIGMVEVSARATGLRPPPEPVERVECFLPVTVPLCQIEAIEAAGHPWVRGFQLASDTSDDIAWAHPDGASASNFIGALEAVAAGECGLEVGLGDEVPMTNGIDSAALHSLEDLIRGYGDAWDVELWGVKPGQDADSSFSAQEYPAMGVLQGALMVFDQGGTPCGEIKFNQDAAVDTFVWGVVFDVYQGPGLHKGAQIYVDFEHDFETPGDPGGSGNVKTRPPGLLVE